MIHSETIQREKTSFKEIILPLCLALIAIIFGYLIAQKTLVGLGLSGLLVGLAIVIVCMLNLEMGLYINMVYSFFVYHISRLLFDDNLPVGLLSDILILATFFGFFVKKIKLKQSINQFAKTSVVSFLLLVYCYMAIQLFNPSAHSFIGWFQTFRKILGTLLLLFISFNVFTTYERIKRFIRLLFVLATLVAIYGCIQQWHGLFQFELDWAMADPHRFGLIFFDGDFRKMSTMPDPTSLAVIMSVCSVFFIAVGSLQRRTLYKIITFTGVLFMILAMSYSGIRTANAMIVAGIVMFILLTLDRKGTLIFAVIAVIVFGVLLYGPFDNPTIDHFRSTFASSNDESFNVRDVNRKAIQPYIYTHPIGGGLGTTGGEGSTYNPGHPLAGFPPDGGYLKKALEIGWIGLGMICFLYFLILKSGIRGYFTCKEEQKKLIYAGCTAGIFCFYVGDFSQVALGQITDIVVYYPFIAILLKLKNLDQQKILITS